MPQRDFEITIGTDGGVELHVKGFKGKGCLEAVKMFEEIVGAATVQRHTSEFYEPDEQVRFQVEGRSHA